MTSAAAVVDSAYAFTAASYAIILTRTLLRRLKHESFLPDDYLMFFSTVFATLDTACYPISIYYGTILTVHDDPEKLTLEQIQYVEYGSKWLLVGRVGYTTFMWLLKACILIYYARLTARTKYLLAVKLAAGLLAVTWIMNILADLVECRPIWLYWHVIKVEPDCAKAVRSQLVLGVTNIFTNIIILAIPLPLIFRAKLPLKTKFEISSVFSLWIFVIAITVIKMAITLKHLNLRTGMIWTQVECFSATVAANAPIIHELWRHALLHIKKGRFGADVCVSPPEYNLTVRAATEDPEDEDILHEMPRTSKGSLGRHASNIRNSIRKINERIRSSFDDSHIERQISVLQETRTGRIEQSSEADPSDAFMGYGPVRTIGTVSTQIFSDSPTRTPRKGMTRFEKLRHHGARE
ncbi:hypothetical protein BDZ45DRAFT_372901 [Acephala macrosclerotiorum]|nr:hypothetical protein BDZ45DRAFT_372901 [Acephala macrosclerotiorum]